MKINTQTRTHRAPSRLRKAFLSTASLAVLCAVAASAQAEILTFNGDTTGDPTWCLTSAPLGQI